MVFYKCDLKNLREPFEPQFNSKNRLNCELVQPGQRVDFIFKNRKMGAMGNRTRDLALN